LVKSARLNFNFGPEAQIRTLPPTDRLTTSSVQLFAILLFDLSRFYATTADFRTRVRHLFSKPRYVDLMSSHLNPQRIKRQAKQQIGKRGPSEPVKRPICPHQSDRLAMFLIDVERVKGIEPSYSAWKAAALPLSYTRKEKA
jgi:hypothetical protein